MATWWTQRRAQRIRRRQIVRALRSEFELERPRGLAALRALARDVGQLERARMTARAGAIDEPLPRRPSRERASR